MTIPRTSKSYEDEIYQLKAQLSAMQPSKPVAYRQHIEVTKNGVTTKEYGYSDIQIMEGDDALYLAPPSAEVLVEALREIANSSHSSAGGSRIANEALESYEAKLLQKEG